MRGEAAAGTPVRVAVVGHTNAGKTSLIRTLTRDVAFGEVSVHPGTTRHVEGMVLLAGEEPVLELYDTPGLEDSMALLDLLEEAGGRSVDGIRRIETFLEGPAARGELAQEAKVLRQVLAGDIALYVIDAREAVLGKYRDELAILSWSARPVVPVLNFVAAAGAQERAWREQLARLGLHAVVSFDTVLFDPEGERRLLETMQTVLEPHYARLQALIDERRARSAELRRGAAASLADLLIDVAALRVRVEDGDSDTAARRGEGLRERVREREQACVSDLVEMFGFRAGDFHLRGAPVSGGRWQTDPFAPETLRVFGITAGGGALTGAAIGLGVDALTGGLSLGAAAAIGAAVGASWSTLGRFGGRLLDRVRGRLELRVDDPTLEVLAARQLWLVRTLLRRGHASLDVVEIDAAEGSPWRGRRLPRSIRLAREHPRWSRIGDGGGFPEDGGRGAALHELQRGLLDCMDAPAGDRP